VVKSFAKQLVEKLKLMAMFKEFYSKIVYL